MNAGCNAMAIPTAVGWPGGYLYRLPAVPPVLPKTAPTCCPLLRHRAFLPPAAHPPVFVLLPLISIAQSAPWSSGSGDAAPMQSLLALPPTTVASDAVSGSLCDDTFNLFDEMFSLIMVSMTL